jgi:hydroxyacylglutathione hydrolase
MLEITPIEAFTDNYIWLLQSGDSREAWVVDPGDAGAVLDTLAARDLALAGVLITHHHFDHVGGLDTLAGQFDLTVFGPHNPAVPGITRRLSHGDRIEVLGRTFDVMEVPGHTLDHIAYYSEGSPGLLFCGDTLFAGGCGRVFEGTPEMMHHTLQEIAGLPADTRIYCAHEYTLANLAFARAVEPDNDALLQRIASAEADRARGIPTVPSSLALELATNPFLRCAQPAVIAAASGRGEVRPGEPESVFSAIRAWKNDF